MADHNWSDGLLEAGLGDVTMARLVGWPARVARMVEVEVALGRALADCGRIPLAAADAIAAAGDAGALNLDALASRAARATTPVIPLIADLAKRAEPAGADWLHYGATSQDIVDTAVVLQLRDALDRLDGLLEANARICAALADRYRATLLTGRTLLQPAVPITFGLKAARWLSAMDRRRQQLRWLRPRLLTVQLGGAAGTMSVYGDDDVGVALADRLELAVPALPWHAERDRIAELAGALATTAGVVGSVATDLVLLAQYEVGEVREATGDGPSSSAMPHKRNPVGATAARAAARLAIGECTTLLESTAGHEHERAAGAWQAEWVVLPSALVRLAGALVRLNDALDGLEVDVDRMAANVAAQAGLTGSEALAAALTPALGRREAQALTAQLIGRVAAGHGTLPEVAAIDRRVTAVLERDYLTTVLDPMAIVPRAETLVDRALAEHARAEAGA